MSLTQRGNDLKAALEGASVNGQRACTLANTWYAIPSTIPTDDYQLIINKEVVAGTVRFAFDNTGTPGTANGQLWDGTYPIAVMLSGGQVMYVASSNAGDTINWTTKELD